MSITVTISGKKSELESFFQRPLTLSGKYECRLLDFSILNSILKVHFNENNNKTSPVIRIECDLICESYTNGLQTHIIYDLYLMLLQTVSM